MSANSLSRLNARFAEEQTLRDIASARSFARQVTPTYPGGVFDRPMGRSPRLYTPSMKGSIWGEPEHVTLSMLKTDVYDRRYFRTKPVTVDEVMRGAFAEVNKDYDDMPRIGLTRPKYGTLLESGGRLDKQAWSELYPFPCQKAVGQVIVLAPDLAGAAQPDAVISMADGTARVDMAREGACLSLDYAMGMKRNVVAIRAAYKGLTSPLSFRLYRHTDQGHRRYMDENGRYIPKEQRSVVYHPVDPRDPVGYYDYEADSGFNGPFDPPASNHDGRFFWIEQVFPADRTFPEGFRYVMMGLTSRPEAAVSHQDLARGLGTPQRMPRDSRGNLILPGATVGHDDELHKMEAAFSLVRNAPGVAGTADLPPVGDGGDQGSAVLYVAVVTVNDAEDYMARARELLLEAEEMGYEGLRDENRAWYDDLYDARENGRVFIDAEDKADADRALFEDTFLSWSYGHGGYCRPNPARLEGSAGYAAFGVDTQSWHSLPCYNELFTEGKWFVRNRPEVMLQWPQLVCFWKEALREKARIIYGLPGLTMGHGYLPPAAPDSWYIENQTLDFCVEVPGQVMKVIWNLWDYTGDEAFLRETAYPLLRELAIFYEAFARRGWDGRQFNLEPAVETESYGISYQLEFARNTTAAIAMFRYILNTAAAAARSLALDGDLIPGWLEVASNLPPYPTFRVGLGEILAGNPGAMPRWSAGDHEINSANYPATLADEINLDSPQERKDLIIRTADTVRTNHNTEPYILTGAFPGHIPCGYNRPSIPIRDGKVLAQAVIDAPERLLNSRSGRIHLFPAVPGNSRIAFRGFLARGGIEVSAARDEGGVTAVSLRPRRSQICRLMNPWQGCRVSVTDEAGNPVSFTLDDSQGECIVFDAVRGCAYSVDRVL